MPHIVLSPTAQLAVVTILGLGILVFMGTAVAGYLMRPKVGITTVMICTCLVIAVCGALLGSLLTTGTALLVWVVAIAQRRDLRQQEREHTKELASDEED